MQLRVLLPDAQNLQLILYFLAKAAGYFDDEHLPLEQASPSMPNEARAMIDKEKPDVMLLPAPMLAAMAAEKQEIAVCANLLANDPINLVAAAKVASERGLSPKTPLRERLLALKDLRLGVAPHPPPRLRALFTSVGLRVEDVVKIVTLRGHDQNGAFTNGEADLLYAHTPFLERAIVHDKAVLLVDQSGGEVPELSNRQIHALAWRRSSLAARRPEAVAMVRALAKAGRLLRDRNEEAGATLARFLPARNAEEVKLVARLYAPAVPRDLGPRADEIGKSLVFFPEHQPKPDLSGIDLSPFVDPTIAKDAQAAPTHTENHDVLLGAGGLALVSVGALLALRMRRKK